MWRKTTFNESAVESARSARYSSSPPLIVEKAKGKSQTLWESGPKESMSSVDKKVGYEP